MKCKRLLLLPGLTCIILPLCLKQLQKVAWIALMYFSGTFMILANFPSVSTFFHKKPLYVEDLEMAFGESIDRRFKIVYEFLMMLSMSILVAGFADYIWMYGLTKRSPVEILGLVGGNITVYLKFQNIIGKALLKICFCLKQREENKQLQQETVEEDS